MQPIQHEKPNKQLINFCIDSHTHLLDYNRQSHLSLESILKQSHNHNLKYIAANTCCTSEFSFMSSLASNNSTPSLTIIPCYGIHPCYLCEELKPQNQNKDWKVLLKEYLIKDPLSHVGEIGLDFRKDVIETNPQDKQWEFFQFQFQLAYEMKRSVTVHCVRAYGELLKYLKKWNTRLSKAQNSQNNEKFTIILHSYGGSKQITKSLTKLTDLQIFFSLSLKHSKDILEFIPLQQLILETDAPYQSDYNLLIENGFRIKDEIEEELKMYSEIQKNNSSSKLLKECKFFNKSVLDNRPINVIANYRELAKCYKLEESLFRHKVSQNAIRAFKLLL